MLFLKESSDIFLDDCHLQHKSYSDLQKHLVVGSTLEIDIANLHDQFANYPGYARSGNGKCKAHIEVEENDHSMEDLVTNYGPGNNSLPWCIFLDQIRVVQFGLHCLASV